MQHSCTIITTALITLWIMVSPAAGQDNSAFIYGTITTDSDEQYTGYIRWGKEEMYWHDIFNADKEDNFQVPNPKKRNGDIWEKIDWSLGSIWNDNHCENCNTGHVFACMFGEISSLETMRGERAMLIFKNGSSIIVDGSSSNDVGSKINMVDYELGNITFSWDDISNIQFSQAPADEKSPYGSILYGSVKTERRKSFTGFIEWDMDERNGADIMDGESKYGEQNIPFEKILKIVKIHGGDAVEITFQSGRTIELDGSNDCDNGNRGIGVYDPEIGSLEIEWDFFDSVTLSPAPTSAIAYDQFGTSSNLVAEIYTFDDRIVSGAIAYDKDEIWEFEMLDGDDGDLKMKIPFKNISKIVPKNRSFSMVYLKNGESYLLGDRQDVNYNNEGILMLQSSEEADLIEWENIDEIIFKQP